MTTPLPLPTSLSLLHNPAAWLGARMEHALADCDHFNAETYQELLAKAPSPALLAEHRTASRWLLGMGRLLQDQLDDSPGAHSRPARRLAAQLEIMEANFDTLHRPLKDAEADAIIAQAFPDAPRA